MVHSLLAIFVAAGVAPILRSLFRGATGWLLALVPATAFVWFAARVPEISGGALVRARLDWAPSLGVNLTFLLDGLSLLFALLITGIGALVTVYSGGYLAGHPHLGRFYSFLFLFMGAMLGLVLADNGVLLFIFWELTSISSYLLIGFHSENSRSRAAALMALLVTGLGGLALLAGVILLSFITGSTDLSALAPHADTVRGHALSLPVVLLISVAAFTKSAQFPFHFWLPAAMEAPTPVSAYLHSATMVKAGVYLLARLHPALGGTEVWTVLLCGFGTITMLTGACAALVQTDLKRILAYATVSVLGTLTLLLGVGTPQAAKAAVVYLLAHSLYKGALFLVAGCIDHAAGTRDIRHLGGLARAMPVTTTAAVLASLSLAGIPPFFGFVGKEVYYEALIDLTERGLLTGRGAALMVDSAAVGANALMTAVAGLLAWKPLFGPRRATPRPPREAGAALWLGPAVLGLTGVVFGILSGWTGTALVARAAGSVMFQAGKVRLALWHGFNTALLLSVVTLAGGVLLYLMADRLRRISRSLSGLAAWGPARWYEACLTGLTLGARWQTRLLQSGNIRDYLLITVCSVWAVVGYGLFTRVTLGFPRHFLIPRTHEVVMAALILLAACAVVVFTSRLAVITALGVIGCATALMFLFYGAPDLAMTQMTIETLSVILYVLVVYRLPQFALIATWRVRLVDALVGLAVGGLVTTLMLAALASSMEPRLSPYYAANSLPLGQGRNVVNVILVDFRALDTLGEITVLSVAAMGVHALLRLSLSRDAKR